MAESTNGKSSPSDPVEQHQPIEVQVVGQYIRDLSFENPSIGKLLDGPGENPNLQIEVNVNAERKDGSLFESAIAFKAHASNQAGTIYDLELVYSGLFRVKSIPEAALEPFLLINCPTLIFPFLRRLVSDITREGGFPPLLLDPIDFAALYVRRRQGKAAQGSEATN